MNELSIKTQLGWTGASDGKATTKGGQITLSFPDSTMQTMQKIAQECNCTVEEALIFYLEACNGKSAGKGGGESRREKFYEAFYRFAKLII